MSERIKYIQEVHSFLKQKVGNLRYNYYTDELSVSLGDIKICLEKSDGDYFQEREFIIDMIYPFIDLSCGFFSSIKKLRDKGDPDAPITVYGENTSINRSKRINDYIESNIRIIASEIYYSHFPEESRIDKSQEIVTKKNIYMGKVKNLLEHYCFYVQDSEFELNLTADQYLYRKYIEIFFVDQIKERIDIKLGDSYSLVLGETITDKITKINDTISIVLKDNKDNSHEGERHFP